MHAITDGCADITQKPCSNIAVDIQRERCREREGETERGLCNSHELITSHSAETKSPHRLRGASQSPLLSSLALPAILLQGEGLHYTHAHTQERRLSTLHTCSQNRTHSSTHAHKEKIKSQGKKDKMEKSRRYVPAHYDTEWDTQRKNTWHGVAGRYM